MNERTTNGFVMIQPNTKVDQISWKNVSIELLICWRKFSLTWASNREGWDDISMSYYSPSSSLVLLNSSYDEGVLEETMWI